MEFEKLSTLVELLCRGSRISVCVCDISGILQQEDPFRRLLRWSKIHPAGVPALHQVQGACQPQSRPGGAALFRLLPLRAL